jgi:hypothetical protein
MSQELIQRKPWVLVSVLKSDLNPQDADTAVAELGNLVDEWHSQGKIMWSGAFDDNKTSMTIFEAAEEDASDFFAKYNKICNKIVDSYMYQWDAMPILSLLAK